MHAFHSLRPLIPRPPQSTIDKQLPPPVRYALSFVERVLPGANPLPLPPGTGQNWTQVVNLTMASMQQNGVCRPEGGGGGRFTDLFAWVNHGSTAHFEGATVYKGRACNVWASTADPKTAPLKLCVDATSSDPVVLDMHQGTVLYEFGTPITRGPPPEAAFTVPATCGKPAVPCPAHGVIPLRAVVFHPAGKLDIAGQDVGDVLGDTTFMCIAGPNASSGGKHIEYLISIDSRCDCISQNLLYGERVADQELLRSDFSVVYAISLPPPHHHHHLRRRHHHLIILLFHRSPQS